MADRREREDDDDEAVKGGEGGLPSVIPPSPNVKKLKDKASRSENVEANTEQHSFRPEDVFHDLSPDQAHPSVQNDVYGTSSMSAALPNVPSASYSRNIAQEQLLLMASEALPITNQDYARAQVFPPLSGQLMAPSQHFRHPFHQGRQTQGFPTSYNDGSLAFGHPQGFGHPFPQPLPHLQSQQPMVYGHGGAGYYPVQQQFARQPYNHTSGIIFRQNQGNVLPSHASGTSGIHGYAAARFPGLASLQTGSTSLGKNSSESSPTSPTPRGPPRKPKQSGYALWCGNLPAQTNIVELKDHFSRNATDDIGSVFLISKSNCAFINYRNEESCTSALARFHDSRFEGAKLVCRLRKASTAPPAGTPTGPRTNLITSAPNQVAGAIDDGEIHIPAPEDVENSQTTARKAEEKFFVLKSLTIEDLAASVLNGSWATQSHNEAALNAAYKSAGNVYLVFSANKSGEYYGYARMLSGIDDTTAFANRSPPPRSIPSSTTSADNLITIPTPATEHAPKGRIIDDSARGTIFWEADRDDDAEAKIVEDESTAAETSESDIEQQSLGHPFKIEWISTEKLPFHRTRGLRNPWNQNREVKIARDGTEIEPSVGRRLMNLFHSSPQAVIAPSGGPPLAPPQHGFQPGHRPVFPPMLYPADPRYGRPY